MTIEVVDNPEASRYELQVDGQLAGLINYHLNDKRISMVHAEVSEQLEGHGLGGMMAHDALEDVRKRGLELVPMCPFILNYVHNHQDEYLDLVTPALRARVSAN